MVKVKVNHTYKLVTEILNQVIDYKDLINLL